MEQTMLTYIQEEPKILTSILRHFDYQALNKVLPKKINKVLILATGSSFNAALAARYYLEKCADIHVDIEEPFNFEHFGRLDKENDLIFLISQSGKSASILHVMEKIKNINATKIVITNSSQSLLNDKADYTIKLNVGEENVGYVTKGFSGTLLNMFLIGCTVALHKNKIDINEYYEKVHELEHAISHIPDIINGASTFFSKNQEVFTGFSRFSCIAYGSNIGISKEFETKFTETVRLPSFGYELEAYMHGPYLEVSKNHALLFIVDENLVSRRSLRLRDYMNQHAGATIVLGNKKWGKTTEFSINTQEVDELFLPLLYVVPIQVWSYMTATINGNDLITDPFPDFDRKLKSKLI